MWLQRFIHRKKRQHAFKKIQKLDFITVLIDVEPQKYVLEGNEFSWVEFQTKLLPM